jgi:cation transport regulator ChaC
MHSINDVNLVLKPGEIGLFSYGSLLSRESMTATLRKPYIGPVIECGLKDTHRTWNVLMPNYRRWCEFRDNHVWAPESTIYLNITPKNDVTANGILYVLPEKELEGFDRREWVYNRKDVTHQLTGVNVTGGQVFVYVGRREYILNPDMTGLTPDRAGIEQEYIDIVKDAVNARGDGFSKEFFASTDTPPPERIFVGRSQPFLLNAAG